jgi:penicillin-insensitive murein endopeptidase
MHIRLACPKDSVDCVKQEATPSDEGCDATLEWWFSKEAEEEFKKIAARMENPVMPELPNRCKELISK